MTSRISRLALLSLASLVLCSGLVTARSHAASGLITSYSLVNAKGSTDWYNLTGAGGSPLANFHGFDFGEFVIGVDTLTLQGGQVTTYKNGGSNVTGAELYWQVYPVASGPSGSFAPIGLTTWADATFTDAGNLTLTGFGDQKIETTSAGVDLLAGLTPGDYSLDLYAVAHSTDGDHYHSNSNNNYTASFSVAAVPEASSFLFGGVICGLGFLWKRLRASTP